MTSLPWQSDLTYFQKLKPKEKHHFIPKSPLLRRFLDPAEWANEPNRKNHLRRLDIGTRMIGWQGLNVSGQRPQLNFAGSFSSERYWGEDDGALAAAVVMMADDPTGGSFLAVPALAALHLRSPSFRDALAAAMVADGMESVEAQKSAVRGIVAIADRVKRDWVAALDRGRVEITVLRIDESVNAAFVVGDVPAAVMTPGGAPVLRPAWLWEDEWFPDEVGAEEPEFAPLTIEVPVSSHLALRMRAGNEVDGGSYAELESVEEDRAVAFNAQTVGRAAEAVWGGRAKDLEGALELLNS